MLSNEPCVTPTSLILHLKGFRFKNPSLQKTPNYIKRALNLSKRALHSVQRVLDAIKQALTATQTATHTATHTAHQTAPHTAPQVVQCVVLFDVQCVLQCVLQFVLLLQLVSSNEPCALYGRKVAGRIWIRFAAEALRVSFAKLSQPPLKM